MLRDGAELIGPLGMAQMRPGALVEGLARGGDGAVDIGLPPFGDADHHLLCIGGDHVDHVVSRGFHPVPVDEQAVGMLDADRGRQMRIGHEDFLPGYCG